MLDLKIIWAYIMEDGMLLFECPHCSQLVQISIAELNCKIFRHAVYKNTMHQVDPHMGKEDCDRLFMSSLVWGCAKPFRVIERDGVYSVEKCDYI